MDNIIDLEKIETDRKEVDTKKLVSSIQEELQYLQTYISNLKLLVGNYDEDKE